MAVGAFPALCPVSPVRSGTPEGCPPQSLAPSSASITTGLAQRSEWV